MIQSEKKITPYRILYDMIFDDVNMIYNVYTHTYYQCIVSYHIATIYDILLNDTEGISYHII